MPKPFAFEPGVEYMLGGVGYLVLRVLSEDQILVKNLMTKGEIAQKASELRKRWQEDLLEFGLQGRNLREEEGQAVKTSYEFTDIAFLGEDLRYETWDRYQLILPLLDLPPEIRKEGTIRARIESYVAE